MIRRTLALVLCALLFVGTPAIAARQAVARAEQVEALMSKAVEEALPAGSDASGPVAGSAVATATKDPGLRIQEERFPDSRFRHFVQTELDANCDGYLSREEREVVQTLDLSNQGIEDLSGVKYFPMLKYLYLQGNALTTLSVKKNTQLVELDVSGNRLKKLSLSKNTKLTSVNAEGNRLKKISVRKCAALTWLNVLDNKLSALDVSGNKQLAQLYCSGNKLRKLSLKKNTKLQKLWCGDNKLTSLSVSKCAALSELACQNNRLTKLKVTGNPQLTRLYCQNNYLTGLDVTHNPLLTELACQGNRLTRLDVAAISDPLRGLLSDDSLYSRKGKVISWYASEKLNASLPASITLYDGAKILYGGKNMMNRLSVKTKRADYAGLTDEEYANFRCVNTTGMGKNALYRSSSPIQTQLNRNRQADAAAEAAGIRAVVNLSESAKRAKQREGYADSYYSTVKLWAKYLFSPFHGENFEKKVASACRFIAANEGPYLVHCVYGKDRTGFVCAVLECLMGADIGQVVSDYMITYYNYYGILPGTGDYKYISRHKICKQLAQAFDIPSVRGEGVDLARCAEQYLLRIGLSQQEILDLREKLSVDYP